MCQGFHAPRKPSVSFSDDIAVIGGPAVSLDEALCVSRPLISSDSSQQPAEAAQTSACTQAHAYTAPWPPLQERLKLLPSSLVDAPTDHPQPALRASSSHQILYSTSAPEVGASARAGCRQPTPLKGAARRSSHAEVDGTWSVASYFSLWLLECGVMVCGTNSGLQLQDQTLCCC